MLFVLLENHRTDSQFESNRVTKLLLFEFVNNFMSLFYIAFYLQDIPMLQWVSKNNVFCWILQFKKLFFVNSK